jgi:glutamate-1-semialdehyde aminotransferase
MAIIRPFERISITLSVVIDCKPEIHIDFNDVNAIQAHTDNKNIVAVMLEPIQGESGVYVPKDDYLNQVQSICQANNWLLILDEVQTGIGRTGKLFAHQYNNLTPDVLTLAKGLGNGVPIGVCLAKGKAATLFTPGTHGSTFTTFALDRFKHHSHNVFITSVCLWIMHFLLTQVLKRMKRQLKLPASMGVPIKLLIQSF